MNKAIDYSLYLVTEEDMPISGLSHIVEQAVAGGVTVVQLREKNMGGKAFYEKARQVKLLLDEFKVPLIINDRADIAVAVKAAGVHVGQSDLPVQVLRKFLPSHMAVGVSVRTVQEAELAHKGGADYLGVGAVFPTSSKGDAKLISHQVFKNIQTAVPLPVVAIGGISKENAPLLSSLKPDGLAVISAITRAEDPHYAAVAMKETLKK